MKKPAAVIALLLCTAACAAAAVRYATADGLSGLPVCGAVKDRHGLMWFSTSRGLDCYDGYEFHHLRTDHADSTPVATNHIYDIRLGTDGNILCHTDNDIHAFSLTDFSFHAVTQACKDSVAPLMGSTWRGMTDSLGTTWHGTRNGLYKTVGSHHPAAPMPPTLGMDARALLTAPDGLWVGTRRDCMLRRFGFDGDLLEERPLPAPPYCLYLDGGGGLWTGCKPGGLLDPEGRTICSDPIYDIAADGRGNLWLATFGAGVKVVAGADGARPAVSPTLGGRKVRKILITDGGNIVAATTEGLLVGTVDTLNPAATELRPVRHIPGNTRSLASDATMSLASDGHGRIFIATESSGLDCIDEEALMAGRPEFVHFDSRNGLLPTDICNALAAVADSVLIVMGTDNMVLFNPLRNSYVNYSGTFWADSVEFGEATPAVLPDGTVVVGAFEGAFSASPHHLHSRGYRPPLVFTTLSINGAPDRFCLPGRDALDLAAGGRNVTIGFAAIDFTDNTRIRYRTRLDGSAWTAASTVRKATLFSLTPGRHVLEVQSTDRYGRWVDNAAALALTVAPYWHETWWAAAVLWAGIGLFAGGVVWTALYMRRVHRQRRELLQKYLALLNGSAEARPAEAPVRNPADEAFLNRLKTYIEANIANADTGVDDMAAACAVSRATLNRRLRSLLGTTAAKLLLEARMQRAEAMMALPGADITAVADACGFADPKYFRQVFRKRTSAQVGSTS